MRIFVLWLLLKVMVSLKSTHATSTDLCSEYTRTHVDDHISVNKYPSYQVKPHKILEVKSLNGVHVSLKCVVPYFTAIWHFQSCSNSYYETDWKTWNVSSPFNHELHLQNVSETDSGYYRCTAYGRVYKIYKLVVYTNISSISVLPSVITNQNYSIHSYEEKRLKRGDKLTIKCNTPKKAILEFLRCTTYNNTKCDVGPDLKPKWHSLFVNENFEFSRGELIISNISTNHSGFYRCISRDNSLKIYNIYVINSVFDGPVPKIMEVRAPMLIKNSHIKIKCKVYSEMEPSINWLRESDEGSSDLEYSDKFYESINRSTLIRIPFQENIYYGELVVQDLMDVENFVCLAMTQFGKDFEIINIVPEHTTNSLLLLISIPLLFVLIPFVIWLCCVINRSKYNVTNLQNESPTQKPLLLELHVFTLNDNWNNKR